MFSRCKDSARRAKPKTKNTFFDFGLPSRAKRKHKTQALMGATRPASVKGGMKGGVKRDVLPTYIIHLTDARRVAPISARFVCHDQI